MKSLYSLLFILIVLVSCAGDPEPGSSEQKSLAYAYAEDFVKQKLKSPSSATFPGYEEKQSHVEYVGENKYKITSWVESQNSFGAMMKTPFSCTIRFEEGNVYSEGMTVGN